MTDGCLDDDIVERQTVDAGNLIHRVDDERCLGCSNLAAAENAGAHRRAAKQRAKLSEQLGLSAAGFGENDEHGAHAKKLVFTIGPVVDQKSSRDVHLVHGRNDTKGRYGSATLPRCFPKDFMG